MIAGFAADHLPALVLAKRDGVLPGELHRALHGFRAAGGEKGALQAGAGKFSGEFAQAQTWLAVELARCNEDDLFGLRLHRRKHAPVAVTEIVDDRTGRDVDVAPPVPIPHEDTFAPYDTGTAPRAGLEIEVMDTVRSGADPFRPQSLLRCHLSSLMR
jgi:hypothetical protein